jgi:predicted RNA binding protein YcfA (HicA-like mRNA interferase family)
MGRLSGFKYRHVVKRLKNFGFVFDRRAAGSHKIWYNPITHCYTTIPNYPGDMPEGHLARHLETGEYHPRAIYRRLMTNNMGSAV